VSPSSEDGRLRRPREDAGVHDADVRRAIDRFRAAHGRPPLWCVRAPGRVNLIGEHTDHQQGLVLPIAIDRCLLLSAAPGPQSQGRTILATSERLGPGRPFDPSDARTTGDWTDLLRGVLHSLPATVRDRVPGLVVEITGDLPPGAGASSSAAVAVGFGLLASTAAGAPVAPREAAAAAVAAENRFLGVPCGIMDPLVIALAKRGNALAIDCLDASVTHHPLPTPPPFFARIPTGVERELRSTPYGSRVAECAAALELLRATRPELASLRDLSPADLDGLSEDLPARASRRVRHVVTENARVERAVAALVRGDLAELGRLLDASHRSLRDDFEVSLPPIDRLVDHARRSGAIGARLIGAGFGGSILALLPPDEDAWRRFERALSDVDVDVDRVQSVDGARVIPADREPAG